MRVYALMGVLLVATTAPATAEAQGFISEESIAMFVSSIVGGVVFGTIDVVLISEGIDKAVRLGHGLYGLGAGLEIIFGGLQLAIGLPLIVWGIAQPWPDGNPSIAFGAGIPLTLLGGYLLGHGLWSFYSDGRPPAVDVTSAGVAPTEGGAVFHLAGSFG